MRWELSRDYFFNFREEVYKPAAKSHSLVFQPLLSFPDAWRSDLYSALPAPLSQGLM